MKQTKRILSVVLAVAMLLGCFTLPAAATVTSQGTYWQEDFTGQEKNTNLSSFSINTNSWNYVNEDDAEYQQKVRDSLIVDGVEGVYGKAPFDTAFLHQVQWDEATLPSGDGVANYSQMRISHNFGSNVKDIRESGKAILHYSFDYASNENYLPTSLWTTPYYEKDDGSIASGYADTYFFAVTNAGKVTTNNQTIVDKLAPNTWYHFDFVFDMGNPTASNKTPYKVYVNGELKGTFEFDALRGTGEKPACGFRSIMFQGGTQAKVDNVYPLGQAYYDNVTYETLATEPTIAPLSLTSSNTSVVVDNSAKTITLDNGITPAADVESALSGTTVLSVDIKDATGTSVEGNAADGNYLCVTTTGNTVEYYTISAPPAPPTGGTIEGELKITGTAKEGYTLTADTSAVTPAGVILTYSWKRDGVTEVGTDKSYTVAAEDVGHTLTLTVTAVEPCDGTLSATSETIVGVTGVEGISSSTYTFDNEAKTIVAPVGTVASDFYSNITLPPVHTGVLVDAGTGEAVAEDTKIELDSDTELKYRVSAAGENVDYTLVTKFVEQDFEGFTGKKFYNGANNGFDSWGFTFPGGVTEDNAYIEAVDENGNLVMKAYTNAGSGQLSMRRENIPNELNSRQMVFGFDYKAEALDGLNKITIYDGNGHYWDMIYFNANGTVTLNNGAISAGRYNAGEWNKVLVVMDLDTTASRVYINGDEVYNGNIGSLSTMVKFQSIIYAPQLGATARTTYVDNFILYPIASVEGFDASGMQSAVTSDKVKISEDNIISGYGSVTAKDFVDTLINVPSGATATIYTAENAPVGDDTAIAEGMKLVVQAREEGYSTTYTFGESIVAEVAVLIDSNPVNILYPGTASATADVFVQSETQLNLKLEKFISGDTSVAAESKETGLTSVQGEQTLSVALDNTVADEQGTSLKATLLDEGGAVIATKTIAYSDALELGTEIMKVKDNRKGIYTITMDDGYKLSTQQFYEPWFEKYDLRGTTVAVYNCFKDGGATYTPDYVTPQENREYFNELLTKGNFEMGSHSNTHPTLTSAAEDVVRYETLGSIPTLESAFPGQQILTFTSPGNTYNDSIKNIIKEGFYAARGGNEGSNNLDALDNSINPGGMYDLKIRRVTGDANYATTGGTGGVNPTTMNKWLDDAVANGEWVIEMWHTVAWKQNEGDATYYSDGGYLPMATSYAEEHLAYASKLQAKGDLWVATFNEATKYQQERLNAVVDDQATRTSRVISLTDNLPDDIFNYPLTLRSEVPADWTYATVTQDGKTQRAEVVREVDKYYIYYDATPDKGDITIAQSDVAPATGIISAISTEVSEGTLTQKDTDMSEVTFTANVTANGEYDVNDIEWYVNGVRQYQTGTTFSYTPTTGGDFGVIAKANVKQADGTYQFVEAEPIIIAVEISPPPPELYLVNDNFDDRTPGTLLATSQGKFDVADNRFSDKKYGIRVITDPTEENTDNIVVQFAEDSDTTAQTTPLMNVPVDSTKPLVLSGKVYMNYGGWPNFMIAVRDRAGKTWATSEDMRSLLSFLPNGVIGSYDTWFNATSERQSEYKWVADEWIRYDIYLDLNQEDMTQCSVRVVLSGGITDAEGVPVDVAAFDVGTVDLSVTNYLTKGTIDVSYIANLAQWYKDDTVYADDIKIYQQNTEAQALTLTPDTDVDPANAEIAAELVFDLDASTLTGADKIKVTAGAATVSPTAIEFDPMEPNKFTMKFDADVLAGNTTYTVSFDESVKDLFGASVAATATFTTAAGEEPEPAETVELTASATGAGVVAISGGSTGASVTDEVELGAPVTL
ncbi:MAG TPA: polysaccharide deacetylase family protein, partial [Candidatus Aphodoplasma excrementigallinarum]|nr:polysaccharide deacetylase family protein [Candidatus Aphodoplasma excrementigallinarum]